MACLSQLLEQARHVEGERGLRLASVETAELADSCQPVHERVAMDVQGIGCVDEAKPVLTPGDEGVAHLQPVALRSEGAQQRLLICGASPRLHVEQDLAQPEL